MEFVKAISKMRQASTSKRGRVWSLCCEMILLTYSLKNQPTFHNAPLVFQWNDVWEMRAEIPHW